MDVPGGYGNTPRPSDRKKALPVVGTLSVTPIRRRLCTHSPAWVEGERSLSRDLGPLPRIQSAKPASDSPICRICGISGGADAQKGKSYSRVPPTAAVPAVGAMRYRWIAFREAPYINGADMTIDEGGSLGCGFAWWLHRQHPRDGKMGRALALSPLAGACLAYSTSLFGQPTATGVGPPSSKRERP